MINSVGRVIAPGSVDFIQRDIPALKADEALIKIASSCICGSDLHIFKGMHPSVQLPETIGHELAGTVIETGGAVTKIKTGDRVTVEPVIACGACYACLSGDYGYCENISFTYRNGDGAMADYIVVKEPCVHKLPEEISYECGALIEPLAVAVHAVRRAHIELGENVIIFGAGAIGILIAALCRRCGAKEVAIVDYTQKRLELALELGATAALNPSDVERAVAELSQGRGMDKSFECVGLESTFVSAMESLKKNGLATIVGIFESRNVTIPATRFITHEIKVQGSQGYCRDFPIALEMARQIDIGRLITHRFPLGELQLALDTCMDPTAGVVKACLFPENIK